MLQNTDITLKEALIEAGFTCERVRRNDGSLGGMSVLKNGKKVHKDECMHVDSAWDMLLVASDAVGAFSYVKLKD